MALWRRDQHRRQPPQFGGQSADGGAGQDRAGPGDECRAYPGLWLGRCGGNISTSSRKQGNSPGAYDYNPNTVQMDQAVLYLERTPDTVQTDHVDWGFRVAAIYGTDYRYTVSDGLFSGQYLTNNKSYGFDLPMVYADIYIPKVAKGLELRIGRYITLPDIEAQLAPNNYMYSHSLAYSFDNYTNTGIQATLALSKEPVPATGRVSGQRYGVLEHRQAYRQPLSQPALSGPDLPQGSGRPTLLHRLSALSDRQRA
jgi:hypothetical protein